LSSPEAPYHFWDIDKTCFSNSIKIIDTPY